ncbi:MAG: hypothetical protein LBU73_06605 [Helicobacteraceae bacterium]|jgi:serine O-acetyltransferase|nr:hypothetical protein [Helicobacteraceae bacterium]
MNENISEKLKILARTIGGNYDALKNEIKVGAAHLPNAERIAAIFLKLRELLFPGYFAYEEYSERPRRDMSHTENIEAALSEIHGDLSREIALALPHIKEFANEGEREIKHHAEWFASLFLEDLPKIRNLLSTDARAAFDGDPAAFNIDEIIASYPGFFATVAHRLAHKLYSLGVPLIPRIWSEFAHSKTGIDIHPGATIGHHFFIDHGTGVVIGETTIIGNYVKIYQGVTLGGISTRGGQTLRGVKRHPTIEDYVTIYSGASIFGGETTIGRHSVIGSNVFVASSVLAHTKVSLKNPELQYKDNAFAHTFTRKELEQEEFWSWVI